MSGLVLRRSVASDSAAILDLWQLAWAPVLPAIDFAARRPWFADYLAALEAQSAQTWVACADAPTGFINFHPGTGYIDQLAVHPSCQGQGVAQALVGLAKDACPAGLTLKVNQQNPRAVAFYQRQGFMVTGEAVSPLSGLALWTMAWAR